MTIPEIMVAVLWACMVTSLYLGMWFALCWQELKKDYYHMQQGQRMLDLAFV